jgi:membrane protease YdiL (CAAX protease family)
MSEGAQEHPREPGATREALGLWSVAFVLVLALALLAGVVGLIAGNLYALVAAVFVGIPLLWSERRGVDWAAWGIHTERLWRNVGWGLAAALVTLVGFVPGYHLWQVQVRGEHATPGWDNLHRWDATLEGVPSGWGEQAGVWVFTQREALHVGLRAQPGQGARAILRSPTAFRPEPASEGVLIRPLDAQGLPRRDGTNGPSTRWEVLATAQHRPVQAVVVPDGTLRPRAVTVEVEPVGVEAPAPLYKGPQGSAVGEDAVEVRRGLWWLLLWALTQLFLIAWPEEVFYRGAVQTRLAAGLGEQDRVPWRAILATSVLFGLGHLLVPVQGVLWAGRASVFFPSLVFGLLRWRTGSVIAPAVYHACCNMMVLVMATQYR